MVSSTPCFDLHSHSTASDGSLAPAALAQAAAGAGVDVLALTDHDTVSGLAEARQAAGRLGLRLIDGVEISVRWQKRTLHIVGLGIAPEHEQLAAGLQHLQQVRDERADRIALRLEKLGVAEAMARVRTLSNGAQITRTHFARLLVNDGQCRDMKQAFKRYLGAGKPAHVAAEWATLEEAVDWIHGAGGVAVLAHPMLYNLSAAWRQRMLKAFKEVGGDALEVCCGHSNAQQTQQSTREALDFELLGSVGSDFHSPEQRWIRLGGLPPLPSAVRPIWNHPRLVRQLT